MRKAPRWTARPWLSRGRVCCVKPDDLGLDDHLDVQGLDDLIGAQEMASGGSLGGELFCPPVPSKN
jgi:hypothetical protein